MNAAVEADYERRRWEAMQRDLEHTQEKTISNLEMARRFSELKKQ